jgi:hypothetical protein
LFCALFLSTSLYSQQKDFFEFIIKPVFNGEDIQRENWYQAKKGDSLKFKNVKFYVTDVKLELADSTYFNIQNSYYLIDVFDNNTQTRLFNLPKNTVIKKLCFSLGVSDTLNKSGALSGDLDPSKGMYWAWQSGYINMKIEGQSPSCPTRKNRFAFHLGGYKEPYTTLRNVVFPVKSSSKKIVVEVDVAKFINAIDLRKTHTLMIPGKVAYQYMNAIVKMFSVN